MFARQWQNMAAATATGGGSPRRSTKRKHTRAVATPFPVRQCFLQAADGSLHGIPRSLAARLQSLDTETLMDSTRDAPVPLPVDGTTLRLVAASLGCSPVVFETALLSAVKTPQLLLFLVTADLLGVAELCTGAAKRAASLLRSASAGGHYEAGGGCWGLRAAGDERDDDIRLWTADCDCPGWVLESVNARAHRLAELIILHGDLRPRQLAEIEWLSPTIEEMVRVRVDELQALLRPVVDQALSLGQQQHQRQQLPPGGNMVRRQDVLEIDPCLVAVGLGCSALVARALLPLLLEQPAITRAGCVLLSNLHSKSWHGVGHVGCRDDHAAWLHTGEAGRQESWPNKKRQRVDLCPLESALLAEGMRHRDAARCSSSSAAVRLAGWRQGAVLELDASEGRFSLGSDLY